MSERILVVEEDDASREALAALLIDYGYDVETAPGGADAMSCVARCRPGLIISDVAASAAGLAMVRQLRQRARCSDIPVILVSTHGGRARWPRELEVAAADQVDKPIDPVELIARVEVHLRRGRRHDPVAVSAAAGASCLFDRAQITAALRRAIDELEAVDALLGGAATAAVAGRQG